MSKAGLLISSKNQEMAIDKKKWINKLQYIHEMKYYTAIQKKKRKNNK